MREDQAEHQHARPSAPREVSDAWLVARALELIIAAHHGDGLNADLEHVCREIDRLLAEARRRGEPRMVAQILRAAAIVRLATPDIADHADPLLDELLKHTRRHGLVVLEADAHALRGRRALIANSEDVALTETAAALAMLEHDLAPDVLLGRRTWERLLATALVDIGLVLTRLGMHERADEIMARAHRHIWESGGPHDISLHLINRVRLLLGWGLRLERVGKGTAATERFAMGSAIADAVEGPWRESLFPGDHDRPAAEQVPVLGAAHAFARPGSEHLGTLQGLLCQSSYPREIAILSIALARCFERHGQVSEALNVLADAREELTSVRTEPTLRLAFVREYARLSRLDGQDASFALEQYASALEDELWVLREARIATLDARRVQERLFREHHAITAQAMQDPLTGLPNRRALDERLERLIRAPHARPLSVALVDLDGFKAVNDRCSHADGDDVLRVVASTLRDTLRTDDMVARYGGDEFVVLLPGAVLSAASAALGRTAQAVAGLPEYLARGVTLSVGAVCVGPNESAGQVLARADDAMYQAKREGGNRVAAPALAQDGLSAALNGSFPTPETFLPPLEPPELNVAASGPPKTP